jgi:hypothetical protein
MKSFLKQTLAAGVLLLSTVLPSSAGLFDNLVDLEGTVAAVQSNHFFLINDRNEMVRIMLKPGQVNPDILPGLKVTVTVEPGSTQADANTLYLYSWENHSEVKR